MGKCRGLLFLAFLPTISWLYATELSEKDLMVAGYLDAGRFQLGDKSVNGEVLSRVGAKWGIDKEINENWSASADLLWVFWRNQATDIALFHIAGLKFDADLRGKITYRNGSHRFLGGVYDFKYNPDAKNLGEYLLRSEAYPTILESSQGKDIFSPAFSRVAGFEYSLTTGFLRQTALLYAEQYNMPVNDLSSVYLATMGTENFELGFGLAYHRFLKLGTEINDGTLNPDLKEYVKQNDLETKAIKLSLRSSLDLANILGLDDNFKFYGEAALLGLKKDTLYYKDVMQRMPFMVGLDIPTLQVLRVLSIELEYFKNPYYERKYSLADNGGNNFSPLPFIDNYSPDNLPKYTKDDFRWSVFMHRALSPWLDLKLRLASDHLRLKNWNGDVEGGSPMTRRSKDWYAMVRLEFHN